MKVELVGYTENALDILVFSRNARLLGDIGGICEIENLSYEDKLKELDQIKNTINSSWEFVDYTFVIRGVTRAFCLQEGTKVFVKKVTDKIIYKNRKSNSRIYKGVKNIEDIKIGDSVFSYNVKTGEKEWDKVVYISNRQTNNWYKITFDNGNEVHMTDEHPVYIVSQNKFHLSSSVWRKAKDLKIGDEALQYIGLSNAQYKMKGKTFVYNPKIEIVKVVKIEKSNIWRSAYNIETKHNHNFFANGILTHNTHQLVRHRVGTSFAQQSLRAVDMSEFDYLDSCGHQEYRLTMESIRLGYKSLVDEGVSVQKARGVLPINVLTNILFKCNLRALNNIMNVRLCVRTQGEFQDVAVCMKSEILKVHPWTESFLEVYCVQHGVCCFLNYKDCPLKREGVIKDISSDEKLKIKRSWQSLNYEADPLKRSLDGK